ncbi:MAG: ferrous iron transport protein A [Cyanothece sp. SIO2G6]|nr:ferrous iron transport protein A [Cyanothece sp. SIO2G6]
MVLLSSVQPGTSGVITALATDDPAMINRLLALGISPGNRIYLEQRFPAYIIRMGQSRASLDQAIANTIYIQPS